MINTKIALLPQADNALAKFVEQILQEAALKNASDIHFEPQAERYRIRIRIDGLLYEINQNELAQAERFATILKIMANLDIAEKRLPQDGRFNFQYGGTTFDCRLSSCPTLYGEKLVVRLLPTTKTLPLIETLGMEAQEAEIFKKCLSKPQGIILVTGPTGSGKTLTLYSALNFLNTPEKNILTVEDPVEIKLTGITQVAVQQKIGLTFARTLRAFLRQDPDIIMVGEIRDQETAEIAMKAAQTGHLVLATLHANSAAATLTRLKHLGIHDLHYYDALNLIVAQRLARLLCPSCKQETEAGFVAVGCSHCQNGYRGRTGVFELLPLAFIANATALLNDAETLQKLRQQFKLKTLAENGAQKVALGITSKNEIQRIMSWDVGSELACPATQFSNITRFLAHRAN